MKRFIIFLSDKQFCVGNCECAYGQRSNGMHLSYACRVYILYALTCTVCEELMEAAIVEKGPLRHSTYNIVQVHFHWVGGVSVDSEL